MGEDIAKEEIIDMAWKWDKEKRDKQEDKKTTKNDEEKIVAILLQNPQDSRGMKDIVFIWHSPMYVDLNKFKQKLLFTVP